MDGPAMFWKRDTGHGVTQECGMLSSVSGTQNILLVFHADGKRGEGTSAAVMGMNKPSLKP